MLQTKILECDLCVVGGGISGMVAAISAAREGVRVVLMHERPVLGGNASSEIRMWISNAKGKDNRETGILEEICLESLYRNPNKNYSIWDTILYDFVRREENITLLLNCTCMQADTQEGTFAHGREKRIVSVTGYQMTTQVFYQINAKYFSDCSGDSILAPLCGAEFRLGREASSEFGEDIELQEADTMTMGMSCLIQGRQLTRDVTYIPPTWSRNLTKEDLEKRNTNIYAETQNFWYLELGGDRDSIGDTELIRDDLVELAAGMWDYVKNSGNFDSKQWDLDFLGFLPGKRESRRMCGEYMITQRDISDGRVFPDEIAFGGWPLDDHYPGGFYHRGTPNTDIRTPAPYSIPYRALYSKNVDNLFFAGRNISMTHFAMSSIRIMATCSLLGQAVGKAASIAVKQGISPHDVYLKHTEQLQDLLMNEDSFLPSKTRRVSNTCKQAKLNVCSGVLRNGQDRAHAIYGTDETNYAYFAAPGEQISYCFDESKIGTVHIVFCSDLNRVTLPGGWCEQSHVMRANQLLSSPVMHLPKNLCKEFRLIGERNGVETELLHVDNNRKRAYHIPVNGWFNKLKLIPVSNWSNGETIPVISFDFN